jgi:hypothetical protein
VPLVFFKDVHNETRHQALLNLHSIIPISLT